MAQSTKIASPATELRNEIKILSLIGTGHMMSHFYSLTLPLLITFLAADFGYSPTQLGFLSHRLHLLRPSHKSQLVFWWIASVRGQF